VELADRVSGFFVTQARLQQENSRLKQQRLQDASQLLRNQALQAENGQLRKLLAMRQRFGESAVLAEIVYAAHDPFSRKIVLDKGMRDGLRAGQAVIDDTGVVGQVTREFPLSSEVTLLTDKDQAVPVQLVRNGLRAIVYGLGQEGVLEMRFMPVSADIQNGDVLVTSGIDGVYPPGLPVAVVSRIERNAAYAFAKIHCAPSAGTNRNRQYLVLAGNKADLPPPPPPKPAHEGKAQAATKEGGR
jgi:rod shape-determining protein MreC